MPTESDEYEPVASYGMLSDCNTAALVSHSGSIDWLCLPHYDSAAVFCRVLDPVGETSALQIMYGIHGEHDLSERELPHLPG